MDLDKSHSNIYNIKPKIMDALISLIFIIITNCVLGNSEVTFPEAGCNQNKHTVHCAIIPIDIPDNVTHVVLHEVQNIRLLTYEYLNGTNWKKIKYMEIYDTGSVNSVKTLVGIAPFAMMDLTSLEELKIISVSFRRLYYDSFAGLDNLRVLNFTGCEYLEIPYITKAITGDNTLPNLEVLSMTYLSLMRSVDFDEAFFNALAKKPIKLLDIHRMEVKITNLKYMKGIVDTLQYLNLSRTKWSEGLVFTVSSLLFDNLKLLNVSFSVLPMGVLSWLDYVPFISNRTLSLTVGYFTPISNVETIDVSGINSQQNAVQAQIYNLTVYLTDSNYSDWLLKNLIMKYNKLKYLDITFPCTKSNLESLDFSFNVIEFLQPNFCPCCKKLTSINLSNNKLYKMLENNYTLFVQLVRSYPNLRKLGLSSNRLTTIPEGMFNISYYLEEIDLSDNLLVQVIFGLENLGRLKTLNLKNNRISIFDDETQLNLRSLFVSNKTEQNVSRIVQLNNNPVSCAECHTLSSVNWLLDTLIADELVCKNPEGVTVPVDQFAANSVQIECDKPARTRNIILLSTLVPVWSIALIVIVLFKWRRYKKQRLYKRNMDEKVRQIRQNELETNFVVFLSFSSYDYDFLNNYVYRPLKQHLQQKTETDRDLICIGDKNFQLGRPINDEMVISLQQSAVVLLLLSRNFCDSEFCRMEFDHALYMKKPIILMVKENVEESRMVPSLQELFKRNTRILWEKQGDTFQLKTSWENVCNSILELVK